MIVVRSIGLHDYVAARDGLLSLSHVRNHGAAFGLLSDWNLPYQSLSSRAEPARARGDRRLLPAACPPGRRLPQLALALILGGAVGNLIDRLRLGYVVDFVHVYWRDYQWPDFNVADSAITIGVALLVIDILQLPRSRSRSAPQPASTRPTPAGRTD